MYPVTPPVMQEIELPPRVVPRGVLPSRSIEVCHFSPDSRSFAVATGDRIVIYPVNDDPYELETRTKLLNFMYSPDGNWIVTVHASSIQLWDVEQRHLVYTEHFAGIGGQPGLSKYCAFSPASDSILVGCFDMHQGQVWELNLGTRMSTLRTLARNLPVGSVLLDFAYVNVADGRSNIIYRVRDIFHRTTIIRCSNTPFEMRTDDAIHLSVVSSNLPNTNRILLASPQEARILDFTTHPMRQRQVRLQGLHDRSLRYFQLSHDGRQLFFYSDRHKDFCIVDSERRVVARAWQMPVHERSAITCAAYSRNGSHVLTGYEDGSLKVWTLGPVAAAPGPIGRAPGPGLPVRDYPTANCPICIEPIPENNRSILACGHHYCWTCIDQCYRRGMPCPTCRAPITTAPILAPMPIDEGIHLVETSPVTWV